jgi:uncharacterized membrane protein YccC
MSEAANLRSEIPAEERKLIAGRLRVLEESSLCLTELFRPFESSLVRRQPLSRENAERLQRINSRLRSMLSHAAWDLGLPPAHQDALQEVAHLAARMEKTLGELVEIGSQGDVPQVLAGYLQKLGREIQRIVGDIEAVAGRPASNSLPVDSGRNA